MAPWSVDGFKGLRFASHTFFVKRHSVRNQNEDNALFLLNVPPFVNEQCLHRLFGSIGEIRHVRLRDKTAHVVFRESASLERALKVDSIKSDDNDLSRGSVGWIERYNRSIPDLDELKRDVDSQMRKYDRETEDRIRREKEAGEADQDGWVTVTGQGRKPGFERKESVTNKITSTMNARRQKKELKNFYTFQIRESKMNHIVALRQRFEQDKKKIALLKSSRRFKPF